MSFTYDKEQVEILKKSKEIVGYLQPVIREKGTTRILVGRHRKHADPNWPERVVEVKDDLDRELIILHGNRQRIVSTEESQARLLRIARVLERQGIPKEKICAHLVKTKRLPWTERHIRRLLPDEYKMKTGGPKKQQKNGHMSALFQKANDKARKIKTALDDLSSTIPFDPDDAFPFKDCLCKKCPHKNECY